MHIIMTELIHNQDCMRPLASLRLWQLISPTLPIGAYAYSQGLEAAIEADWVKDETSTQVWLRGLLLHTLAHLDLPVLIRLYHAWQKHSEAEIEHWNRFLLACRESAELLAEDRHLGQALCIILADLEIAAAQDWRTEMENSYANMFALGTSTWGITLDDALRGYCWAWCENQVAAAIKLIPLGQTAGQRILSHLLPHIVQAVSQATLLTDDEIGVASPGLAIASALHETQYSRLFRS